MPSVQRFLVKMLPAPVSAKLSLAGRQLNVLPLYQCNSQAQPGVAAQPVWHLVEPSTPLDTFNPWDVCHALVSNGMGMSGAPHPEFAEPDFAQTWLSGSREDQAIVLASSCTAEEQEKKYPWETDKFWYQDPQHGQFDKLLAKIGTVSSAKAVRVAHLDTGYDPHHRCLPVNLEHHLERNFVDEDRPNDASDDSCGLVNNPGHGTATLSVLAGNPLPEMNRLGAAPFVKVVPIRVANRFELFYNSAIVNALRYVRDLCQDPKTAVQVVTMSMGGLPSQLWAEEVNALYEEGVVLVAAAGNNFGNAPTHHIVYPARFNRVIAACGVMADHKPYADLPVTLMAGNHGPASTMRTAMAAYTPNIPRAKFGCSNTIDWNGGGTSSATPQIAAAAAIWIQKNRTKWNAYPDKWMRVEAVRTALFNSANNTNFAKLGHGELRALDAYGVAPPTAVALQNKKEEVDAISFPFLRVLTGLGMAQFGNTQQKMLELESLQLSQSAAIQAILPDPDVDPDTLSLAQRVALAQALSQHPRASQALRRALQLGQSNSPSGPHQTTSGPHAATTPITGLRDHHLQHALRPVPPAPEFRRLRVYAYDPLLGRTLETVGINETTLQIPWETDLLPGPVGEYLEVVDVDPASGCCYAPVDLNDPRLLATDGLQPSEANPQFHQQMAYAVAMRTIRFFENALGRVALWAPRFVGKNPDYVQRLRIYPHALREPNAYYSPQRKALLLGYFSSSDRNSGVASEYVFTALSHDIVAHETTHALLDGLHRRFIEPTNPDVLAFHEGFADIVALFQHFTLRDSLRELLAYSRGDLSQQSMLAWLAVQFGQATGHYKALRDAIGTGGVNANSQPTWTRRVPKSNDYQSQTEAHDRGAVLVSAVFDAFLQVYTRRAQTPIRLATHGSEVLPQGALQSDLVDALTNVASTVARHILTICIRALDYCPPVDITFGDFLRALVTADHDLVPSDPYGYRVAFSSAFMARGIYPEGLRSYSVDTLRWEPPLEPMSTLQKLLPELSLQWTLQTSRESAWNTSRDNAWAFHRWLMNPKLVSDTELGALGLYRHADPNYQLQIGDRAVVCDMHGIEVHSVRPLRRVGPDGQLLSQMVVELTQSLHAKDGSGNVFRGGVTLVIDLTSRQVTYVVRKRINQPARLAHQQHFQQERAQSMQDKYRGLRAMAGEPFALVHRSIDGGGHER
ncbi:S8 family serine peptidase [Pseudomonas sp. GM55]|uniref:S8 family serine peptidase n=1 Tax=Pseudomonas sp. GM55 TaxID=1144333 RepID=UPI000270CD95|nr:S8 family serine peptidase [Pseudomonas sp. GM55]EJM74800.1 subtilisin-like serine protease [Pseudomonas sp. GM55]